MKKRITSLLALAAFAVLCAACSRTAGEMPAPQGGQIPAAESEENHAGQVASSGPGETENAGGQSLSQGEGTDLEAENVQEPSAVYMTEDISSEGLMKVYEALEAKPAGRVAVKLSTGEPGSNYLRTELIGDLVQSLDAAIVECNTAYGGSRASTAMHYQVAEDHGYTAIADVDIMDEEGSMTLPVTGGRNLTENYVGAHFANYDYYVILSHFKGHAMAGYGGAIKNISIGIASAEGKNHIHTAGKGGSMWSAPQDPFLESMAEAGKSVADALDGRILYINVMNRLSVDCDCDGSPAEPDMHDIGSDFSKNLGRKEVFRFTLTKNRLKYTTKYSIYTTKWPFWNEM